MEQRWKESVLTILVPLIWINKLATLPFPKNRLWINQISFINKYLMFKQMLACSKAVYNIIVAELI